MAEYIRIAVDPAAVEELSQLAREATHIDDLAPGRAIEWMLGEYKRVKLKLTQFADIYEMRIKDEINK